MRNFPLVTIYKNDGQLQFGNLDLNGEGHHFDRIEEKLFKDEKIKIFEYEVIWNEKVHHRGFINFRKQRSLKYLFEYLYSGRLRLFNKNIER